MFVINNNRKISGEMTSTGEFGDVQTNPTFQCCHCNVHFEVIKGSGKVRGFCRKCNQVTCGHFDCNICIPFEVKMEYVESRERAEKEYVSMEQLPTHGYDTNEKNMKRLIRLYPELAYLKEL